MPVVLLIKSMHMLTVKLAACIFPLGMFWAMHEREEEAMSTELSLIINAAMMI